MTVNRKPFNREKATNLYLNTNIPYREIAEALGCSLDAIKMWASKTFDIESRSKRKRYNCSIAKAGENNAMFGKRGESCPNWKHGLDSRGYRVVPKPEWYTAKKGCRSIFEHQLVYCEENNITEIPLGYIIHHKDGDILNNEISNLRLMTASAHSKLHHKQEKDAREKRYEYN